MPTVMAQSTPPLSDVTVCAADSASPELAARALDLCMGRCAFAEAILFSDVPVAGNFRHVAIPKLTSLDDYSRFCLKEMGRHIKTAHALVVQWDGYVVDPAMWDKRFRQYDYVGAPIFRDGRTVVGNGGFSLRSRKLMRALARLPMVPDVNEDWVISEIMRPVLERDFGIRFAPLALAERFSYEQRHPGKPTFGFHGQSNFFRHESDAAVLAIYAMLPPSALLSLNGFGLIVTSLRAERKDLAQALYARLRSSHDTDTILRRLTREVPADIVQGTIDALEQSIDSGEN
jgi:hypothetical protein